MKSQEVLDNLIKQADIHASRLSKALQHISSLNPLTKEKLANLSDENLGFMELLTSRFAKLQDLIGSKIFSEILIIFQEDDDNQSNLDKLNKLEKLGVLPSVKDWLEMRLVRNSIAHEYPDNPDLMYKNLTKTIKLAGDLLEYWQHIRTKYLPN